MAPRQATIGKGQKRKAPSKTSDEEKPAKKSKKQERLEMSNTVANVASGSGIDLIEGSEHWINRLSSEILSVILYYLPVRDRNSARMACKNWFDASNKEKILLTERFFCNANENDVGVVMQTLKNSQRVILNLALTNFNLNKAPWSSEFWIECGPKIRFLELGSCSLSDETLKLIVQNCDQLVHLVLEHLRAGEGQLKLRTGACLDELIKSKVSRMSLEYFAISGWEQISNNFLRVLFTIYPNIKHLFYSVRIPSGFFESKNALAMDDLSLRSTKKLTFAAILKKLIDSQNTLESFGFGEGWLDDQWASKLWKSLSTLHFPSLKEVRFSFEIEGILQDYRSVVDFFSKHKQLERVYWWLPVHATPWFMDELMNSLLKKCPRLKSLELIRSHEPEAPVKTNSSVFTNLIKSKLESLTISFGMEMSETKRAAINKNLKTLCITDVPVDAFEEIEMAEFFRSFRGLTKLDVDIPSLITDDSLQSIIKHQPNLKNLRLYSDDLSDYGFTGVPGKNDVQNLRKGSSIKKLSKLEILRLQMAGEENWEITEKTLAEFKFPNLKFLAVQIPADWEFTKEFLLLIPTFPNLEILSLTMREETIDRKTCLELCSQLKWLTDYHISFKKCENFDDEIYKSVFESCPSLRLFSFKSKKSKRRSYYYDVVTRNIIDSTKEGDASDDDDDSD